MVAFVKSAALARAPAEPARTEVSFNRPAGGVYETGSEPNDEALGLKVETDYGQVDNFELVHRPAP